MTLAVSSSSLSSFSTSSANSASSSSISTTKKVDDNNIKNLKLYQKLIGIEGLETQVESFACVETYLTKNILEGKSYKKALKKTYDEALRIFKKNIGISAYFNIVANAISDLKRVVPNAPANISANKSLLSKRIFCNLFKKVKLIDGNGFLRSLFPNEDIILASKVMDYSIDPDVLKKMHQWVEDINLIIMIRSVAQRNNEVFQDLQAQNLLAGFDSASLETVHVKAQSFRDWINGNNNVLLNITELNFNNLGLTSLPSEIDKFVNLQSLNLGCNYLTQLPYSIGNLGNLLRLSFWVSIFLTQLPDTIGNLGNLRELDFSFSHLTQLPDSIGNLRNLRELDLSNNHLTKLPDSIGNLINLEQLRLSDNQLTQLPDTIDNLGNLQSLDLSNNHLTQLPDTFGSLGNLQWRLALRNNLLTQLPEMTNLPEFARKEILQNSSLKARVSYYLSPYIPKKETVIAAVASVAFGYLTYTYFSSND